MHNNLRFEARREFFGSIFYDFEEKSYLAFDSELTDFLEKKLKNKDLQPDKDTLKSLQEKGLFKSNKPNYYFIKNKPLPDILSAPLRLHFAYTSKCNLRCAHCLGGDYVGSDKKELTYKQKVGIFDQMEKMGVHEVLLSGGEPFLEPDFIDFLREGVKRRMNLKIFTNGLVVTDKIIDEIKDLDITYISVSLDGACDKTYGKIRGVAGTQKVIEVATKMAKVCKADIVLQVTATKANFKEVKEHLEIAKKTGVSKLKIRPIKPGGSILENQEYILSAEEYLQFIKNAQKEWNKSYKGNFRLDYSWGNVRLAVDEESENIIVTDCLQPHVGFGCLAGKISMFIDPFGVVYSCVFLGSYLSPDKAENLKKNSLLDIWTKGKTFKCLRELSPNKVCPSCEYYEVCRGGCIARILYEKQPINAVDPWCIKKYFPHSLK